MGFFFWKLKMHPKKLYICAPHKALQPLEAVQLIYTVNNTVQTKLCISGCIEVDHILCLVCLFILLIFDIDKNVLILYSFKVCHCLC